MRAVVDDYYGTKVSDPYRYMEDLASPEVQAWFKAQNDYTRSVLAQIPGRQNLLARIKQLDEAATSGVFDVRRLPGGRYFYQKRLASEDVGKLYVRDGLSAPEKLLADPTKLAPAGTPSVINYYAVSDDGLRVAYGASIGGSEEAVIHVVDVVAGRETGETIDRGRFGSPSWLPDGHSFFHNRTQKMEPGMAATERELKSKVYLHVVGTDPEKDPVIFGYEVSPRVSIAPTDIPFVATVPGSPYAFGAVYHGVQNEITLYVAPLTSFGEADIPWRKILDVENEVTDFAPRGDAIYLLSHKGASRYQILRTGLTNPDPAHAQVVVSAGEPVVRGLSLAEDGVYVQLLDGGIGRMLRVPFTTAGNTKPEPIALPLDGSVSVLSADHGCRGYCLA